MIDRYDFKDALFYLDPPYWGGENDYGKGIFERDQFEAIANALRDLSGSFILSINDRQEIREIFAGFQFEECRLTYSIARGEGVAAKELLISNRSDSTMLI
ncbi:site-specific DNA-adenine methylase [Rubricella aquisinus]|uniref:Site-specific DNA-adenine methylase n=1 Tax=Rubricella aquisinus TaxID=2028108 RepID=A0A840WZ86_9RHOB|nr:site-specific DNA-adenine methylase [Rubricella aquisinus]